MDRLIHLLIPYSSNHTSWTVGASLEHLCFNEAVLFSEKLLTCYTLYGFFLSANRIKVPREPENPIANEEIGSVTGGT